MKPAKIIQILQVVGSGDLDLVYLDENGSVWRHWPNEGKWTLIHKGAP